MPSKSPKNIKPKTETENSNFRLITGINRLIESRLHKAGVSSFAELAELSPDEIITAIGHLPGVTTDSIIEQNWIGQSQILANQDDTDIDAIESEGFIVNLFLDENKEAHSTQILHVNSDEGEKWDGWDNSRLTSFIIQRSGLILPTSTQEAKSTKTTTTVELTESTPSVIPPAPSVHAAKVSEKLKFQISSLEMFPKVSQAPGKFIKEGEEFELQFSIDFSDEMQKRFSILDYSAIVFAKGLDILHRVSFGKSEGEIKTSDNSIRVPVSAPDLKPGTYSLEASITFTESGKVIHPITEQAQAKTLFQVH